MENFDHQQLDEIIHSRIRLAIMAVLVTVDEAEFNFLKEKVNATDGNLSTHLKKLEDAGYIAAQKSFENRKPVSRYLLTVKGKKAFEIYIEKLENMLKK
ncbi:MAG TPA: transcriptional regulator [Melioribacteraceae bacterium]|nr:transcriptional regulator [Melioribacteraceae bacterium]